MILKIKMYVREKTAVLSQQGRFRQSADRLKHKTTIKTTKMRNNRFIIERFRQARRAKYSYFALARKRRNHIPSFSVTNMSNNTAITYLLDSDSSALKGLDCDAKVRNISY